MTKHMRRDLDRLLDTLRTMAGLVEAAVGVAAHAVLRRDRAAAADVWTRDDAIDALENTIQDHCLRVLALHQPLAKDLRWVGAVMLISTDLERIGDLATGIADRAVALIDADAGWIPVGLERMAQTAAGLVVQAVTAFTREDADEARAVIRADDEVDAANDAILADVLAEMKQSPEAVPVALSYHTVTRHLERIADHATNIAEDVIFLVEGAMVRHRDPFASRSSG